MTITIYASPVADLQEALSSFPPDAKWYGYDDESLVIVQDNGPRIGYQELAYISPEKGERE
jgi:hypothetical protein